MTRKRLCLISIAAAAYALSMADASALTLNYALRARAGFEADGAPDLGLGNAGRADNAFLDLSPRLLIEFNRSWTGFARGRIFLPTGRIAPFDNGQPQQPPTRIFAGLDEGWIQYNGFTSYPGESLRIGRQLLRENDTEWLGQNVDAIRWGLDSTLLRTSAGVARQLSAYRSDNVGIPPIQQKRIYGFANLAADWRPEHSAGLRFLHAADQKDLPDVGTPAAGEKLQSAQLTWVGLYADNGYLNPRSRQTISYSVDVSYVLGHEYRALAASGGTVDSYSSSHVGALAGSAALRWRPFAPPVYVGTAYTYSQGGGSHQYQQSGLQGDASFFTGTPSYIYRYNEALRAELGNLRVVTAYVSMNLADDDASLIFENFSKDKAAAAIITDGISATTNTGSRDVGNGLDLVLTHYFGGQRPERGVLDGGGRIFVDPRPSLRLRGSVFDPGAAYGPGAKVDYRVMLEGTLWLF